jgi:uncharacterized membrane protein YdjX (TVP38/TMEM64 family)
MNRRKERESTPRNHLGTAGKSAVLWRRAAVLVFFLVVLGVLVWEKLPQEWLDPERIRVFLKEMGILAPLAYILIRIVGIVVTVAPNAPLDIAGGVAFGPFWGTVYALIGSEAGAIVCFLLARNLGKETITRLLHREIAFGDRFAQGQMALLVLLARLEPIFSFALVSYGAGLTRMTLRAFALSTLLGMTPGTILLNYYGKSLFSGGNLMLQICMGLVLVFMLFIIPVWIKRKNPWGLYDRMTKGGEKKRPQ